jgi:hypothetical protein
MKLRSNDAEYFVEVLNAHYKGLAKPSTVEVLKMALLKQLRNFWLTQVWDRDRIEIEYGGWNDSKLA